MDESEERWLDRAEEDYLADKHNQKQFEITKHFASVLSMHFHWIACHTLSDGSGIIYRPGPGLSAGVHKMSAAQVLSAGAAIELGKAKQ